MDTAKDEVAWKRGERVVIATVLFHAIAMAAAVPIIPLFIMQLGVGSTAAVAVWSGLILTVSPFFAAILAPVWGALADRHGLKPMALRAQLASTVVLFGMAFVPNVEGLFLLRVGLGVLGGYGAMSVALLAASVPEEETAPAIGRLEAGRVIGLGIGPLLGGVVMALFDERAAFFASALVSLINLGLMTFIYDEPLRAAPSLGASSSFSFERAGKVPNYLAILAILFLVRFSERSLDPIIPLVLDNIMPDRSQAALISGIVLSAGTVVSALSSRYGGSLLNRYPPRRVLIISLTGGTISAMALAFASTPLWIGVWRISLGIVAGGAVTIGYGIASRSLPSLGRASAYTLLSSGALLGAAVAPLFAGLLGMWGLQAAFFLAAGTYFTAEVITRLRVSRLPPFLAQPLAPRPVKRV